VTGAWAFVDHHNSFPAVACRTAFAFVAVVVAAAWDIVVAVAVAAAVPVELQIVATTNLRPQRSRPVAVAVENLPPKWILVLVRLLRSSSRKQAVVVVVVPAVVAAYDAAVAFVVRTDTDQPDTVDSSCAPFLAKERERKQETNQYESPATGCICNTHTYPKIHNVPGCPIPGCG
jgi:hypothetical protein